MFSFKIRDGQSSGPIRPQSADCVGRRAGRSAVRVSDCNEWTWYERVVLTWHTDRKDER